MKEFLLQVAAELLNMGGIGLLIMGVLDSSLLFVPMGNDLLVIAMTAREKAKLPYFAAMAAAGSVLGTLILDTVARKGGQKGLKNQHAQSRLEAARAQIERRGGWMLAIAAIVPPPFPYKVFVVAAAALQYPRKKLLLLTAGARFARFALEGLLAVFFGTRIIEMADHPVFEYAIVALIVLSLIGSGVSIYQWVKKR